MKYLTDRHPQLGEICTICNYSLHKRAALLFDRVYVATSDSDRPQFDVPPELTFGFAEGDRHIFECVMKLTRDAPADRQLVARVANTPRAIARSYAREQCVVVPSFSSYKSYEVEFSGSGCEIAFEGAFQNISVVDDAELNWDQIIQFRSDEESVRKYRDLRLWLLHGLGADSVSEASDKIGVKLDAYTWSMKKHGLQTVQGALTFLLDYKQAGVAASAAAAGGAIGGPVGSALAGGIVLAGQTSAWLLKRMIEREDVKRGPDCEVAYIHDINRRFITDANKA